VLIVSFLRAESPNYFSPMAAPWVIWNTHQNHALKGQLNPSTNIVHHIQFRILLKMQLTPP
jgi:hypothetical protein